MIESYIISSHFKLEFFLERAGAHSACHTLKIWEDKITLKGFSVTQAREMNMLNIFCSVVIES